MSGHGTEDGGAGGARSASRRVDICGDRGSLKADPARPAFVPALNFPNNINQDSDDEDEGKHEIHIGEEDGTIEFEDLDKPEPTPAPEPEPTKEIDPLAEIEGRVSSETLVLKL